MHAIVRDIVAGALTGPTVFKDESKLSYDYVPDELPGRKEETERLARAFSGVLSSGTAAFVTVHGNVGSGKTATTKRFAMELARVAKENGKAIEWTHINCRRRATTSAALLEVLRHFVPHHPDRGFSDSEMLDTLRIQLDRKKVHLVVLLDEVDILLKRSGSDLVYMLARFNEERKHAETSISLILVSQHDPTKLLDAAAASTLRRAVRVELEKYDAPKLEKIVHQRVELAFHRASFPEELEGLVAEAAAPHGDARLAISILAKAGQNANDEGRHEIVAEDVRVAADSEHPSLVGDRLAELDRHKQLTLLAVARCLKKGGAYAITGDAERAYATACEEYGETPRAHTQFWTYLKDLEALGLLTTKRSGKGVLGTTTLISLPDVPAKVLEEKVRDVLSGT
ncbi:MAG: Cdc6/Cdc18 family protein [Thermoplasmatota archaeon]